jgi:S-adenosylmethionine decarboxylase
MQHRLGTHLLLELWEIDSHRLDDRDWVRNILVQAALEARCTVVSEAFHRFAPQGVSGVVVIAESHISIHTWPELGYAAIDVFTCGDHAMPERAAEYLIRLSGARRHDLRVLERGIPGSVSAVA